MKENRAFSVPKPDSGTRSCGQPDYSAEHWLLVTESILSMKSRAKIAEHVRAYRLRQMAAGNREVTLNLPRDAVEFLDAIKERQGLPNRSQALLQLIEQGRAAAQQTT
jgi:hypothetical protein